MWGVKFTGVHPNTDRKYIRSFFQPYGEICKLYLKADRSEATIYFYNAESANKAAGAIQQPNQHNFQFEELFDTTNSHPPHFHKFIPGKLYNQLNSIKTMDDCEATSTYMYDILGNKILTLIGDDGESYVSIKHLQHSGFKLFDTKPDKLVYNAQIKEYLRMYLHIQMYKFVCKYKCNIHEEDKSHIIASVAADADELIAQNSRASSRGSVNNDCVIAPLRRPKDMTTVSSTVNVSVKAASVGNDYGTTNSAYDHRSSRFSTQQKDTSQKEPITSFVGYNSAHGSSSRSVESQNSASYNNPTSLENRRTDEVVQKLSGAKSRVNNYNQSAFVDKKRNGDSIVGANDTDLKLAVGRNPMVVPFNTSIKVIVKHINEKNPNIAFLHLVSNQDKLESLNRDVHAEAERGAAVSPSDGLICAVLINSVWKRAYVQSLRPLRLLLIDEGSLTRLHDDAPIRGLSETLQTKPWFAVRATTSICGDSDITLQQNCTYIAKAIKKYDDGTYVFYYNSKVLTDDISQNPISEKKTSEKSKQIFQAGTSLANVASSTSKSTIPFVTSTPSVKKTQFMDSTAQIPTILDKITGGMQVIIEFHFETYCDNNSVVAFIYMTNEDTDILEELMNLQQEHMKPCHDATCIKIGDMIAVKSATKGEGHYRAIVYNINNGVYSVAKIDTGTLQDVKAGAILELDEYIKKLPYLTCICTYHDLDDLKDLDDDLFNVNSEKQLYKDGCTYRIQGMTVKPWNPLMTHGPKVKPIVNVKNNRVSIPECRPAETCVLKSLAVAAPELQASNIIRIIKLDFTDLTFYVQTREMYTFHIKGVAGIVHAAANQRVEIPEEYQSVIVKIENSFHRGVIHSISNNRISVKMVDVGGIEIVPMENLFQSNIHLANKKYCCAHFKLDGLETVEDEAISFINECIQFREKFHVTRLTDNRASLADCHNNNLLEKLNRLNLTSKPPGFWYKNLKHINIPIGKMSLVFSYIDNDNGDIYFTIGDSELRSQIAELINAMSEYCEAAEDYYPSKGEICLAFCMEDWCRAYVISANKEEDKYLVFFFDFGNCDEVHSNIIRRLPDESYGKVAPLCTRFVVRDLQRISTHGIPPALVQLLENSLILGQDYDVEVLQQLENNTYSVDIPVIANILTDNYDDF